MRPLIASLLLVLLSLPIAGQTGDVPEIARGLLEAGDQARHARRYSEAISSYERALAVAPRLARAYVSLGAIYFEQGKADDAYDILTRGVQRANPDRTLFANAAAAAQQLGKSSEALGFIDRALALERRDAALLALRSTILRSLQRNDDALTAILDATKADPKDARYQLSAGNLLLSMGRTEEATTAYRTAVTLDKSLLRAWLNLGAIYQKQRLWAPATEAYENAVRLSPNDTSAHYNLGQLYYATSQRERAEEEYRKALAKDASLPLAYLHLGESALGRNEYEKAAQLFTTGMPYYDEETKTVARRMIERAQLALARAARQQQRYADAKTLLDRVAKSAESLLERVLLARAQNDLPAERAALEELLAGGPAGEPALRSEAALRTELALVQLRLGDVDAARANAAALPPLTRAIITRDAAALAAMTAPIARGDAGLLLWEAGRSAQAKPHLAAAHAAIPDWPEVTLALGEIAIGERQFGDAIDLLSNPKCGDVCERMQRSLGIALIYAAAEDPRRAKQLLDRAAALPLDDRAEAAVSAIREALAPRPIPEAPQQEEESSSEPRRTVVVFLPDLPTESDKRLAEAVRGMLAAMPVRLQVELFRRADDARSFFAANRERVGMVIANRELTEALDVTPRFQLTRGGSRTYRRLVVVPLRSPVRSLDDLRGRTVSAVDLLRDAGAGTVVRVPDDLTAAANVLFGKTDAAVVAEANPLVAQHAGELRAITTLPTAQLPVVAYAPMTPSDRAALDAALPRARLLGYALTRIESEPRVVVPKVELPTITLRVPEPPKNVPLRMEAESVQIPE